MSNTNLAQFHFSTLLGYTAHQTAGLLATKVYAVYVDKLKADQAYLLALVRAVGEMYFRIRGLKVKVVDFSQWDAKNKSISEIGCLEIEGYGKVQLVPCGALAEFVSLPNEVKDNIIAYIPVEIDAEFGALEEIEEGTILGFVHEFQPEVALENLEDLEALPSFLADCQAQATSESQASNTISGWRDKMLNQSWQVINQLSDLLINQKQTQTAYAMSSESTPDIQMYKNIHLEGIQQDVVIYIGLIDCSDTSGSQFNLSIKLLASKNEKKRNMLFGNNSYLPVDLEAIIKFPEIGLESAIKTGKKQEQVSLIHQETFSSGKVVEIVLNSSHSFVTESFVIP